MTDKTTRRGYLRSVAGTSAFGLATSFHDGSDRSIDTIAAAELVVPDTEVATGFEQQPIPDSSPFTDVLYDEAPHLSTADTATRIHSKGGTLDTPQRVLSSFAIVADDPLSRPTLETVAQQTHDDLVDAYDAETGPEFEFTQSHTRDEHASDWRTDITVPSLFETANEDNTSNFADLMRLQFFGNVLLGTAVFGPCDDSPESGAMLEEYATHQRDRYHAHGTGQL